MYLTVPTRFNRPTLEPLIAAAVPIATVVVVHTEPGHTDIPGAINAHDYRASIQQWWNTGLDLCDGPTLVVNDDIVASTDDLAQVYTSLERCDLVYLAGHRIGHVTPLTGWCFGLRPDRIRPDEAFQWWYGDDDLYRRAVRDGLRIEAIESNIRHERVPVAFENPVHAAMVAADADLFQARWG